MKVFFPFNLLGKHFTAHMILISHILLYSFISANSILCPLQNYHHHSQKTIKLTRAGRVCDLFSLAMQYLPQTLLILVCQPQVPINRVDFSVKSDSLQHALPWCYILIKNDGQQRGNFA